MARDLMRGGADLMALAMLATRAQTAAERAITASTTAGDQEALTALAHKLDAVAQSVQFFGSSGQAGSAPTGAVSAQIDVTLESVAHDRSKEMDTHRMTEELGRLADLARRAPSDSADVTDLVSFCSGLAQSVLKQTRNVGEITATI